MFCYTEEYTERVYSERKSRSRGVRRRDHATSRLARLVLASGPFQFLVGDWSVFETPPLRAVLSPCFLVPLLRCYCSMTAIFLPYSAAVVGVPDGRDVWRLQLARIGPGGGVLTYAVRL